MADKNTIKNWFRTNLKPTQAQFWALLDSYRHNDEKIPITAIDDIENILVEKADTEAFENHKSDANAHAELFLNTEDKNNKGAANGYTPLNELVKIASQYLSIVDDLVTGGSDSLLSAEQGKVLQGKIDAINLILTSDDINLDTVQELVNAIKEVETSLETILVNDLTTGGTTKALTAEMGKILKGLIDELANTVANLSSSITTTVKPILSTTLATQNVAGFLTYVNALNPVLVVGASEIVKYKLTDTGRVFELNLRGRSFGVGQPAIVASDVLEVTDFLNKDIKLSNYPSTRNDGQLPTNKVLAPDADGNVKLYSIAIAPAPWIKELIPDSYLPDTTGNIRILGDFFTPEMCNRETNPNAIIIGGVATIHYATFVNSQEILANVTTGSVEGNFSITLNNGLSTTKNNALLIVLGTVFKPTSVDWTNVTNPIDLSIDGEANVSIFNSQGKATWNRVFDKTKKFQILHTQERSPLGNSVGGQMYTSLKLTDVLTNNIYEFKIYYFNTSNEYAIFKNGVNFSQSIGWSPGIAMRSIKIYYNLTQFLFYANNVLIYTMPESELQNNFTLEVNVSQFDVKNLRYIELAS